MNVIRWETPASELKHVRFQSLTHTRALVIAIAGEHDGRLAIVTFTFHKALAYRTLVEEYRTALWRTISDPQLGWTRRIVDSPWVRELVSSEPVFLINSGDKATHYLVCTQDEVIDILSVDLPDITVASA